MFRTVSDDRAYQVDVWNLLIGPGQETAAFELPGTAILLVRAGTGTLAVDDDKREALEMGETRPMPMMPLILPSWARSSSSSRNTASGRGRGPCDGED